MPLSSMGVVIGAVCLNVIALIVPTNRLVRSLNITPYSMFLLLVPFAGPSLFIYWAGLLGNPKRLSDYKMDHRRFRTGLVEIINNQVE